MEQSGPPGLVCPPTARVAPGRHPPPCPDRTSDQLPRRSQTRRSDIRRLDVKSGRGRSIVSRCSAVCREDEQIVAGAQPQLGRQLQEAAVNVTAEHESAPRGGQRHGGGPLLVLPDGLSRLRGDRVQCAGLAVLAAAGVRMPGGAAAGVQRGAGGPPAAGSNRRRSSSSGRRRGIGSPRGGNCAGSIWLTACSPPPTERMR